MRKASRPMPDRVDPKETIDASDIDVTWSPGYVHLRVLGQEFLLSPKMAERVADLAALCAKAASEPSCLTE